MARMTGGQALVQSLKVEGIETIFGLPGIQLDFAFDALWEERDALPPFWLRWLTMRRGERGRKPMPHGQRGSR